MKPTASMPTPTHQHAPSVQPEPANAPIRWSEIGQLAWQQKPALIRAHGIAILAALLSVPIPLLLPMLVDEVLLHQPGVSIEWLQRVFPESWHGPLLYIGAISLLTILLRLATLLLNVWHGQQFTRIAKHLSFVIRARLLRSLPRLSIAEYETLGSGKMQTLLMQDVDTLDQFISVSLSRLLVSLLSILGAAVVLLWMHWPSALFILLLNPLLVYGSSRLGKTVKDLKQRENAAIGQFQQRLADVLDNLYGLRAARRQEFYQQQLHQSAAQVRDQATAFAWQSDAASRLSFTLLLLGFDLFRGLAMLMVVHSNLSLGEMFAVFGYLWFLMGPVQDVVNIQYAYFAANAALTRVNRLFALEQEPEFPAQQSVFQAGHAVSVELQAVDFAYQGEQQVLKSLSLRLEAGEKVALVGLSGGGKSTLVQLLLGMYRPQAGQIRFNGVPVEQLGYDAVRQHIGAVLQAPMLLNASLRENLCLGQTLPDARLWQVLREAELDDVVKQLPDGLDSQIGRQGIRLSGGQRQRLALARLWLSDPALVILDEASSALDSQTEQRIHQRLQAFLANRTCLIIAHRLSAVKQAERILVFDDGQIVEQGQHQQLLDQQGLYSRLYTEPSPLLPRS